MLVPGTRIGVYEVQSSLGAGGMGEVYRATDTDLGRQVAIKVLPEAFAQDAERLARFEREARTLASLNHPNIAIVHGLAREGDVRALVMELVEGPTLADLISARPQNSSGSAGLPTDEAIAIGRQIAEALEAAHEQGIIHRDLKPANVKVRDDGTVKVLDFGLAKIVEGPAEAGHYVRDVTGTGDRSVRLQPDLTMSPTITTPAMTQIGMILGTAAYMSPEQARGKPLDKRSDIWAFGCVLFEMLTGRRAFEGDDITDTIAAVVRAEPAWEALPADLPASIRLMLQRCLEKDRKKRIGDMSGVLFVMREHLLLASTPGTSTVPVTTGSSSKWHHAVWSGVVVAASLLAATGVWMFTRQPPPRVSRLEIVTSGPSQVALSLNLPHVSISPDGSRVIYVGGIPGTGGSVLTRSLDQMDSTLLADPGTYPFVSPDGRWVGYFFPGEGLRKVAVTGGPSTEIVRFQGALRGATWGPDDSIVFATNSPDSGLLRVPSSGGTSLTLTTPDRSKGEVDHAWPRFLPGGRAVLFTITSSPDNTSSQVAVLDLASEGATPKVLVRGGSDARYLPTGHLVYLAGTSLRAIPFDVDRLEVAGVPSIPVLESLNTAAGGQLGDFDVADNGTLVFMPPGAGFLSEARTLVWVDRGGKEEPIAAPPRPYLYPRISPDGARLAFDIRDQRGDIWVWDLVRGNFTRVTQDTGLDRTPVWTKDGQYIVYSSMRDGSPTLFRQRSDGTGTPERLLDAGGTQFPFALSPDGTMVLFNQGSAGMERGDLLAIPIEGQAPRSAVPLVATSSGEGNGTISPDGRWLAYQSNESGAWEVYVRPFPVTDNGLRTTVSSGGGTQPRWSSDGRELYYFSARTEMMAVRVPSGPTWSAARAEKLFDASQYFIGGTPNPFFNYDVAKNGRFLMLKPVAGPATDKPAPSANMVVVQNWLEEVKRLVPRD